MILDLLLILLLVVLGLGMFWLVVKGWRSGEIGWGPNIALKNRSNQPAGFAIMLILNTVLGAYFIWLALMFAGMVAP